VGQAAGLVGEHLGASGWRAGGAEFQRRLGVAIPAPSSLPTPLQRLLQPQELCALSLGIVLATCQACPRHSQLSEAAWCRGPAKPLQKVDDTVARMCLGPCFT
jgi:hypothetical protein